MLQSLLDTLHKDGYDNLGTAETIDTCVRHEAELIHIPAGLEAGWPRKNDAATLERRVREPKIWSVLESRVRDPTTSDWYLVISERFNKIGHKAFSAENQMQDAAEQRAGYYGQQGFETLYKMLLAAFAGSLSDNPSEWNLSRSKWQQRIKPLNTSSFITSVLLPELICLILQEDLRKQGKPSSIEDAKRLRDASSRYGTALFPAGNKGVNVEELEEIRSRAGGGSSPINALVIGSDDESFEVEAKKPTVPKAVRLTPRPRANGAAAGNMGNYLRDIIQQRPRPVVSEKQEQLHIDVRELGDEE